MSTLLRHGRLVAGNGGIYIPDPEIELPAITHLTPIGYSRYMGAPTGGKGGTIHYVSDWPTLKGLLIQNVTRVIVLTQDIVADPADYVIFGTGNKSVIGMPGVTLYGGSLSWADDDNIIVRNIKFRDMLLGSKGQRDYITFGAHNVNTGAKHPCVRWEVSNCEFYSGPGQDGLIDSVGDSDLGTIRDSILYGANKATMTGYNTLDANKARITWFGNYILDCRGRGPSYGAGGSVGQCMHNLYEVKDSLPNGTYQGHAMMSRGTNTVLVTTGNVFKNFPGNPHAIADDLDVNGNIVYGQFNGLSSNLYINSGPNKLGGMPESTRTVPYDYSGYQMAKELVENYVRATAGAKLTLEQALAA